MRCVQVAVCAIVAAPGDGAAGAASAFGDWGPLYGFVVVEGCCGFVGGWNGECVLCSSQATLSEDISPRLPSVCCLSFGGCELNIAHVAGRVEHDWWFEPDIQVVVLRLHRFLQLRRDAIGSVK